MSDAVPEPPPEAPKLDFERAEYVEPQAAQVTCGLCSKPITTEYWQSLGKVLCAGCRDAVQQAAGDAQRGSTFTRALLTGGLVALGCGIGYAIFAGLTGIQFAL